LSLQVLARAWTRDILGSPRCNQNHTRETDVKEKKTEYARLIWITSRTCASSSNSAKLTLISTE
jgi:hypothetical protein